MHLSEVDETLITEDRVFSSPDATRTYKPGDVGDATMVVVAGVPGKQFHTLIYDLDKFAHSDPARTRARNTARHPTKQKPSASRSPIQQRPAPLPSLSRTRSSSPKRRPPWPSIRNFAGHKSFSSAKNQAAISIPEIAA